MNWQAHFESWNKIVPVRIALPVPPNQCSTAFETIKGVPPVLVSFYLACNGIRADWFSILPIEDPSNIKKTWDGIIRANTPSITKYLGGDAGLLSHFIVFAEIGAGVGAFFERRDSSIWFEDKLRDEIVRTDLDLPKFIETCLREVRDL